MTTCMITGATGFVGGHLAEACAGRGLKVRALVRSGTDSGRLEQLGAEIVRGDMNDTEALRRAVAGAEFVLHCAAKVGDWGPVESYRQVNVEGLRALLDACKGSPGLQRFIHLSSLGVYEARHHYQTDENVPIPAQHMDGYTQTKVESEKLALEYSRTHKVPLVVLRPGFIYGPGDRTVLPKLIDNLKARRVRFIGSRKYAMNVIYVHNLVHAILLTLDKAGIEGQVFNLTDGEFVSKERFIDGIADGVGVPRPARWPVPLWIARPLARFMEWRARRRNSPEPPRLTMARLKFLGLNLDFSIEKARRDLGYRPPFTFDQGLAATVAWYKAHG
jgi:nucleoside-diphosphate-sugar epimerase